MALYLIIETFKPGKVRAVYQRVEDRGRLMPEGLEYFDSWITSDLTKCYQIVRCEDRALIDEWIGRWDDLVEFEVVEVLGSDEAHERALGL